MMLLFSWFRRKAMIDPEAVIIDEMKKRANTASERLNGAAAKVDDAMSKLLDDAIQTTISRRRRK